MSDMDFVGQAQAERLYTWILIGAGVIGTVVGFVLKDFTLTFYTVVAGFLLSIILVVPGWPFWNVNPVKWGSAKSPCSIVTTTANNQTISVQSDKTTVSIKTEPGTTVNVSIKSKKNKVEGTTKNNKTSSSRIQQKSPK